jgi:hypothetical protein
MLFDNTKKKANNSQNITYIISTEGRVVPLYRYGRTHSGAKESPLGFLPKCKPNTQALIYF